MAKNKKTKSKKKANGEWKMKWTAKDVFEFLKPSKARVVFSILLSVVFSLIIWASVSFNINSLATMPKFYLISSLGIGGFIVAYTLISLVAYFISGRWKE